MKQRTRLFVVMALIFSLVGVVFSPTANAYNGNPGGNLDSNIDDLYLNQKSETVDIEGTSYTYDYSYEGNNRTIYITNNSDNSVEKVSYDEDNSKIYYNDKALDVIEKKDNIKSYGSTYSTLAAKNTWVTVSTSSKYVSWSKGISAAALAAVIAVPLAGLGAAGVIAAMGMGALGVLAAGAIGGTVKMTLQRFTPLQHWVLLITGIYGHLQQAPVITMGNIFIMFNGWDINEQAI